MILVLFIVMLLGGLGVAACLVDWGRLRTSIPSRERNFPGLEAQKDIAAGLGWPWKYWLAFRIGCCVACELLAFSSNIALLYIAGPFIGWLASGFLLAGRSASRRIKMERAFLERLRDLRDRMAVSNQSLDTALQEIGRNPGKDLKHVLAPLAQGGSIVANIVEAGQRSRSPVVEYACGVLIWARSRSLDALIESIDTILLPIGVAQLEVEEESMVTLTQQRAVTMAMSGLMVFMLVMILRVDTFRTYYQTWTGNIVLLSVIGIFSVLVWLLGLIVKTRGWTRWNLRKLAEQQEHIGG